MTNEELNARLRVCAEAGMPYSDALWNLLASAWDQGWKARKEADFAAEYGLHRAPPRNPFRQTG